MLLLIALVIITGLHLSWPWYVAAVVIWLLATFVWPVWKRVEV